MTNSDITAAYYGVNPVDKIYLGDELVWPTTPPEPVYSAMPLTFEIISGGTIRWNYSFTGLVPTSSKTIRYSKNGGEWITITSQSAGPSAPTITVEAGDKIQFVGDNDTYTYVSGSSSGFSSFSMSSPGKYNVYGNIMSLVNSADYKNMTAMTSANTYAFNHLFANNSGLVSAENLVLPAITLANNCYYYMFSECTNLTTAPELPATNSPKSCYVSMFEKCTNLTGGVTVISARTIGDYACFAMFRNCTSLVQAPELPATSIGLCGYYNMFWGCENLTSFQPELSAKYLKDSSYEGMFYGCKRLTTAPELPNPSSYGSLTYAEMFYGSGVKYVKCLVKSPTSSRFNEWLRFAPSTGTFIKDPSTTWERSDNGIPRNWTVVNN